MKIYYAIKYSTKDGYSLSIDNEMFEYLLNALRDIVSFGFDLDTNEGTDDIDEAIDILEAVRTMQKVRDEK